MSKIERIAKLEQLVERKRILKRKVFIAFGKTEAEREANLLAWKTEQGITDDDEVFVINIVGVKADPARFEYWRNDPPPTKPVRSFDMGRITKPPEPKPAEKHQERSTVVAGDGSIVDAKSGERLSLQQLQRFKNARDSEKMFCEGGNVDIGQYPSLIDREF